MYFSIATRQNTAEHFKDLPGWLDGSTVLVRAEFKLYSLSPNPKFKIRTTLTREIKRKYFIEDASFDTDVLVFKHNLYPYKLQLLV